MKQGLYEFRDWDSEARWEWKGREEERGHRLWPRQGINKQTACQAISTQSEQTGRLTNHPHIYGTEPGITQVKKVRCWNNTWVALKGHLQCWDNLFFPHKFINNVCIPFMSQHHCPKWRTSPCEGRRHTSADRGFRWLSIYNRLRELFIQVVHATSGFFHGLLLLMTER